MKWTVGIITAPRTNENYLARTVESIKRAGWSDITIFAEPSSFIVDNCRIIQRSKQYGDWTNWATALYELLLSEPDTDYFFMAEDDVIVSKHSKEYLEYALPCLENFGSASLYTPSICHRKNFQGFHDESKGHKTWSTVTVIMSRDKVISFFSDPDVQRHRFEDIFGLGENYWCCSKTDPKNSIKDAVLGHWAKKNNLPIYYHTPSLAEHIGDSSTLTNQISSIENGRRSFDFIGEDTDLLNWLENPVKIRPIINKVLL